MVTGQNPHRISGTVIVNHQTSQVIIVRPCLQSRQTAKIILQGTADGNHRTGRPRK